MTLYKAYLETSAEGLCMAHIPALPGCCVRAETRDSALQQLPDVIRSHHAWLQRHGEPAPPKGAGIEITIAGENTGGGPFDRGDVAALFAPDREPVRPEEMEAHFRLMAHAHHDLLALVQHLPDDLLSWQPDRDSMSLSRLLRHVGNAEEWYVSRLAEPDTLPQE
jgi:predicted RNase H-like HicB family nuclease